MQSTKLMKVAKVGYIVLSIMIGIYGLTFILKPNCLTMQNLKIGGIICILFGIVKMIGYFSRDLYRLAFQFDFELGILNIVLGFIIIFNLDKIPNLISVIIGVLVLIEGLFKIRISKDAKEFGITTWWLISLVGLLASVLSGGLILWIGRNAFISNILMGLTLLTAGLLNLITVLVAVKIINHQQKDIRDSKQIN